MSPHNLQVGQTLWLVPNDTRNKEYAVTVAAIGRKWATLNGNNGRIDLNDLRRDGWPGYSSDARCWLSEQAWRDEQQRRAVWGELQKAIKDSWRPPDHLTTQIISELLERVLPPERA